MRKNSKENNKALIKTHKLK